MVQCCGVTNKGVRCSNKAKYIQPISGAEFHVCKHHQKLNLLARWDALKVKPNKMPTTVRSWLVNFYEAWESTKNLAVSAKFASSVFNTTNPSHNFNIKYEMYINSLAQECTDDSDCSVCYTDTDVRSTQCGHKICLDCLGNWMERSITCPVCRNIL